MVKRQQRISRSIVSAARRFRPADAAFLWPLLGALIALAALLVVSGCSFNEVTEEEVAPETVVLTDRTGKEWDVSTAIHKYGFEVERFEFGLGPYAIAPLIEPPMLSPGDRGYPGDDGTFLVIGASISGDIRAYGKFDIIQNEVVDEYIGGTPVAVAY